MIDTMIDYAVINQKKAPHWLPLFSSCCLQLRRLNSVTVSCFGWEHESVLLSSVDGLLSVMFQNDCVPSPHLRRHQDDCVEMTRSQPDMEGAQQVLSPNIFVLFGLRLFAPFVRLAGTHTDSATKYDRIHTQVGSCLQEVLSTLNIWPWTYTKLLNSSCIKH